MRTTQLSLLALVGSAFAVPVQVEERAVVTDTTVVWTTTSVWSTKVVYETDAPEPSVAAAGFEGDERPQFYSHPHHKVHTPLSHPVPTTAAYTPPVSTPASTPVAPVPETTSTSSSSTPPPPPPPTTSSSSSVYVAPTPTSTSSPPPPPPTTTSKPPPPPPTTSSSVWVAPTTSAAPAPSAASYSSGSSDSSSSSDSTSGALGTSGNPFPAQGTYYALGLGSCGITSTEGEMVVAVSHTFMEAHGTPNPNNNPMCDKKITIEYKGKTQTAKIVDTCPGCVDDYGLDMSQALFEKFASTSEGRLFGMKWYLDN